MPLRDDDLASVQSLPEALERRASVSGERPWLTLYQRDRVQCRLSFHDLRAGAQAWAAGLSGRGVGPGDRVLLVLPTERAFYEAYWGLLWMGAVPVPVYPPVRMGRLEDYLQNFAALRENCGAGAVVTNDVLLPVLRGGAAFETRPPEFVLPGDIEAGAGFDPSPREPEDLALLQYTSGSTGRQKGVMLSHGNLLTNLRAIGAGIDARPEDVAVTWLPLYHDMGLIGLMMGSVYLGLPLVALSPIDFLRRPVRWLRLVSEHRATVSAGPNFAYSLVARKVRDKDLEEIDLSCWRVASCGAEPIHAGTVKEFSRRFSVSGFRAEAFFPAYGLAENTLAVSFSDLECEPRLLPVDTQVLAREGKVEEPRGDAPSHEAVSVGRPLESVQVAIRDEEEQAVPEGRQGEVVVRGPSVMQGYYGNETATAETIRDGWLRTGDLGFFRDGYLYISGRRKDLVIKAGRNYFAEDLEAAAAVVSGVRPGGLCAFSRRDEDRGTEQVVLIAELRAGADENGIRDRLRHRVLEATGCRPDRIVPVPPRTLPKTSSGKIQRFKARQWYEDGSLEQRGGERRTAGWGTYVKAWVLERWRRWFG